MIARPPKEPNTGLTLAEAHSCPMSVGHPTAILRLLNREGPDAKGISGYMCGQAGDP